MYYAYVNGKNTPLERLQWVKSQPNGVYIHCADSEGQGILIDDEIYHVTGRPMIDKPSVDLTWQDDLTALFAQVEAQAVIAAYSVGAEVELTPEIVSLATAAASITELTEDEAWRAGVRVTPGITVRHGNTTYECIQGHVTQADWTPDKTPALWAVKQAEPEPGVVLPWVAGEAVKVGDKRTFGGKTYECVQAHTTQVTWEPPNLPALWKAV